MADYAIGLSFHKAHRTVVRAVNLTPPCRYFATRDTAGLITLPTFDAGSSYVEIQGVNLARQLGRAGDFRHCLPPPVPTGSARAG